MILLLVGICAILIGLIIGYSISKKKTDEINYDIQQKNKEIQNTYNQLQEQIAQEKLKQQEIISKLSSEVFSLETKIQEKKKAIEDIRDNAHIIESQTYDLAITDLEQQEKELCAKYKKLESELLIHYADLADSEMDNFIQRSDELNNRILEQENKLQDLQQKVTTIVEANKRIELDKQQKDFYRLQLSELDIEEIKKIRSIELYLRQKEPLNKVIWKVYYEKPYTALIGRVIGNKKITGIYKITNLENGMCYVGQSVDIAERWKQHIKRGIGADPATQNKLYPAMLEQGVENFTFELLEECPGAQLTEREKFYTDFYKAQEFGYSIKKG